MHDLNVISLFQCPLLKIVVQCENITAIRLGHIETTFFQQVIKVETSCIEPSVLVYIAPS